MLSSFFPVVPGRTSDAQQRIRSVYQLQVDQMGLAGLQRQLSTGRRVEKPSDDPAAAIRAIGLQRAEEFKTQALQNLKSSQSFLTFTESNLSDVQSLLNEARGLAVQANTNTLSSSEREGLQSQLGAIIDRMVSLGNTRFQDRYLMSGASVSTVPLNLTGNSVRFNGDNLDMLSAADENDFVAHNITAQKALGVISSSVVSSFDLNPGVVASTRLEDLNGGRGVSQGVLQLSDGVSQTTVDLAGSETIQDVVERLNLASVGSRSISASFNANSLVISYSDGNTGTLRISDIGVGSTASDLGIESSTPNPTLPIVGGSLDPVLRRTTKLSQLNVGNGLNFQGGIKINQGGKSYTIELSNAQTIEDIINTVQRSGAAVQAGISPDGKSLQIKSVESGTDFSISESQGDLASRLGLRTFTSATRLEELNHGRGFNFSAGSDLVFETTTGGQLKIDLDGAITIQDVLDRINNNVANQLSTTRISASINPINNGLVLTAGSAGATQPIKIIASGGSEAAWSLGLVPTGATEAVGTLTGTEYRIAGSDPNPKEVDGIYNSLIRLRDAIGKEDLNGIDRSMLMLDSDLDRLTLTRGELGVRMQRIDRLQSSNESAQIELKSQESDAIEADLASVISEMSSRQIAQEASLRILGQTTKMSLFDFL